MAIEPEIVGRTPHPTINYRDSLGRLLPGHGIRGVARVGLLAELKRQILEPDFPGSRESALQVIVSKLLQLAKEGDIRAMLLVMERLAPKELALEQARNETEPNEAAAALMHAWAQRLSDTDRETFEALRRKALFASAPGYLEGTVSPASGESTPTHKGESETRTETENA